MLPSTLDQVTTTEPAPVAERVRPRRRRLSVIGVIGELLITAGVFVFLFLGWQLWLNDIVVGNQQNSEALEFGRDLGPVATPPADDVPDAPIEYGEPVVTPVAADKTRFANIYVPRFGADFVRTVAEGVGAQDVLRSGIGHYPDTQMPGEVGNFALAGHRTTYGAPFNKIADLQVGDRIYAQTADGWYTYVFRNMEYVPPTGVDVLEPVPQQPEVLPVGRVMTMTSCNPMFSAAERIIAYSVFDSWQPASAGPPAEIAGLVQSVT